MCQIFIIYSSADGYISCFHFLAIVSRAAMNVDEQGSVGKDTKSFDKMTK